MTPDGKEPLPSKKYYDIFTTLLTQAVFGYTVAPFIILSFSGTMLVWSRVYFYTLIGVAFSFATFSRSLPFRKQLLQMQSARQPAATSVSIEQLAKEEVEQDLKRRQSNKSISSDASSIRKAPTLGIADDPEAEVEEIVREVKREIEERRRRGSLMQGLDVKKLVHQKMRDYKIGKPDAGVLGGVGGMK